MQSIESWHGKPSGYSYHKCRCDRCRKAESDRVSKWQRKNPQKVGNRQRRYRTKNREVVNAAQRLRYETHAAEYIAYQKAYYLTPAGYLNTVAVAARRRARKRQAECGCVDGLSLGALLCAFSGLCAYCNRPFEHYDHMEPLANGGRHCLSNLVPACAKCNLSKSDSSLAAWLTRKNLTLTEGTIAECRSPLPSFLCSTTSKPPSSLAAHKSPA